ncbi:MAG: CBS domain-containing protein [Desulfovibrio sp.]|jgi:CBS domain-containing membrane protein|nr:CBS domain-containing protein [Desulfovibrio sp.]
MTDKPTPIGVSVDDILAAMGQADGYLDITPDDALALYRLALAHAVERVRLRLTVGRLMTREVHTLAPETPAVEVARMLAQAGVSGAPVVEGGQLVGVVSIKDFLPRLGLPRQSTPMALVAGLVSGELCAAGDFPGVSARELMTSPALTVGPDTPVGEAAALMDGRGINRLPVVEVGRLVGIITRGDVVRASQSLKIAE